jgi:hypothetical protein
VTVAKRFGHNLVESGGVQVTADGEGAFLVASMASWPRASQKWLFPVPEGRRREGSRVGRTMPGCVALVGWGGDGAALLVPDGGLSPTADTPDLLSRELPEYP